MAINKNFVIKNGLEVDDILIFADPDSNRVGILTSVLNYELDVKGGIGASTINIRDELVLDGTLNVGSSVGNTGAYLISTGDGVAWQTVPNTRKVTSVTSTVGQTTFSVTYLVGLIDVFINGVKLSSNEFVATNGVQVILNDPCFGGETVEFIAYSAYNAGGSEGINGITVLDEGNIIGSAAAINSINFVGAAITTTSAGFGVTVFLSDYVSSSGVSTYANVAGISTNVIGGIASVTSVTAGIITATSGFISVGNTTPIQISLVGTQLIFTAAGIGSTSFTLF